MTTRIEHIETEVTPEPEADHSRGLGGADSRWIEQEQIDAALERRRWREERLSADGFDD